VIGFLYPALALAAIAAAIPIILHLIRRREVHRVVFPAIRYLRRAEQRHARRLRLRHLLLLAARVLMIVLAAIAAAGPLVGRGDAEDHRPTALAIVIDASQSTAQLQGDRRLLDLLVERALLSIDVATSRDRVAVFSAVQPGDGALATSVVGAGEYLAGLQPEAGIARLPIAIRQAEAWLGSQEDRARELQLFTDLQRVSLGDDDGGPTTERGLGQGVPVQVWVPDYDAEANGAVGALQPEVEPLSAGQQTSVLVPLPWFGPEPPNAPTVVRLVKGEDVVAVAEGQFGESALPRLPPQDSGWVQGYAEIEHSGLAADDRRFFTWLARPAVSAATLGDPGTFLGFALEALERGGRLIRTEPPDAEVWIAIGAEGLEEGLSTGMSVIVVPPSSRLDLPLLNSRMERARIPWRYESAGENRGSSRIAQPAPIDGLGGLEVRDPFTLTATGLAPNDTVLFRLDDGEPWLVRGTTIEGTAYLLLGSALTAEASEVPTSAAMVPFVDALVGVWARIGAIAAANFEGPAAIRTPQRAREIVKPDGSRAAVEGGSWVQATQAGNYTVLGDDRVEAAFSLNAPIDEADLEQGSETELEAWLPEADWSWSYGTDPDDWRERIFSARRGRLAWRPFVVILLLISFVEASLAAAGRRKPALPG
jgi:hypothetical protein